MAVIQLDMIERICYGDKSHMKSILEEARNEFIAFRNKFSSRDIVIDESIFHELHNLKTTLSMLQAGTHIRLVQQILDGHPKYDQEEIRSCIEELLPVVSQIEEELQEM